MSEAALKAAESISRSTSAFGRAPSISTIAQFIDTNFVPVLDAKDAEIQRKADDLRDAVRLLERVSMACDPRGE